MQLQYLQGQPFLSYKEKYGLAASVKLSNPVLDFNMLYNPLENDNQNIIRLITLHLNNSFTFWYVTKQNEKIELRIEYNYILQDFQCENFLMDNNEEYLICFNKEGILILLSKGQNFPYPKIYRYTFNDVLPPLDQLKKLIYTNDVINDDEEEINEKSNKKNKKEEKAKKEKKNKPRKKKYPDNNIINQEEEKDKQAVREEALATGNTDAAHPPAQHYLFDNRRAGGCGGGILPGAAQFQRYLPG